MEVQLDEGDHVRYADAPVPLQPWLGLGRFTVTGTHRWGNVAGFWTDRIYQRTGESSYAFDHIEIIHEPRLPHHPPSPRDNRRRPRAARMHAD